MKTQTFLAVVAGLAGLASAASIAPRRPDPVMGPATCGVDRFDRWLSHQDLAATVDKFADWVGRGASGQIFSDGKFRGALHMDGDGVTLFACDYKVGRRGSVITPDLVRLALAEDGHLDRQCGKDNAGYERSNDLTIGRTFRGDHYC